MTPEELEAAKLRPPLKHIKVKPSYVTRLKILELRRSDPKHEKYKDIDIARIVGVSKQRVHQILTDYVQPHHLSRAEEGRPRKPSRYRDEDWWQHRRTNKINRKTYNPKLLGRNYKPKPIE